jgi:hypothetical protein
VISSSAISFRFDDGGILIVQVGLSCCLRLGAVLSPYQKRNWPTITVDGSISRLTIRHRSQLKDYKA